MSVTQYIGARYVPMLADPFTWSNTRAYEPLTIVSYQGNSYTSRQYVPIGVDITNENFWASTGNYNAQIEAYRQEVQEFDGRIDNLEGKFDANGKVASGLVISNSIADGSVTTGKIANSNVTTAKIADSNVTTAKIADSNITTAKIADSNVTTAKIADSNVTTAKIADSAITSAKIANGTITNDDIANGTIKKEKLKNDDIFLIFGDSWTNFVDHPDWATPVNKFLNCGTILNYGNGGAGFTVSGNLISTQMNNAKSALTSTQKANVKYVMIMAGVNDHNPHAASGFANAVDNALMDAKNTYPNAMIQWFPTSCAPDYGSAGKWLFCNSTFWWIVGRYSSGSESGDDVNSYCFPACGTMFYFNSNAGVNAFFDSSKLHLNGYGKCAIANAVLQAYGKQQIVYAKQHHFSRGDGKVSIFYTPNSITVQGTFANTGDTDLGDGHGARLLCVMAAIQASKIFNDSVNPTFNMYVAIIPPSTYTYANIEPADSYKKATFSPAGSYSTGTAYLAS